MRNIKHIQYTKVFSYSCYIYKVSSIFWDPPYGSNLVTEEWHRGGLRWVGADGWWPCTTQGHGALPGWVGVALRFRGGFWRGEEICALDMTFCWILGKFEDIWGYVFFWKTKYIPKVLSARKWYKKNGLNSAGCRRRTTISANSSNLDIKMMGAMDPTGSQLWNLMDSKSMTIVTIPFEHMLVTFFSCKMVYTTWKPEETTPVLVTKETKYCEGHFFERGDYATWQQLLESPGVWSHFAGAKRYNEVATVEALKIFKLQ